MSGSGREALPFLGEALPDVREWLEGPPGGPGVVGRPSLISVKPSRMSRSGWKTLPVVREQSGGPPKFAGEVGSPTRISGSGREALPEVQ